MATVVVAGFVRTGAGVAVVGATVDAYVRNTSAVSQGNTTTNASGYWTLTVGTQDRYDYKIVNGTSTTWLSYDDQIQIQRVETAELFIINPANTFKYNVLPAAITADRTLTLPLITATDTLATLGLAQTFTGITTFSANSGVVISGATGNTLVVDTSTFVVDATNNRVGIGGATPLEPLHIVSNDGTGIRLDRTTATTGVYSLVINASGNFVLGEVAVADRLTLTKGGGFQIGAPTGGDKGAGTLNANAVYDDNVLLTDWIFDQYYGSVVNPGMPVPSDGHLWTLPETEEFIQVNHRLPWMPAWEQFENERSLGKMVTNLWQGQEQQQLHIFDLQRRVDALDRASPLAEGVR